MARSRSSAAGALPELGAKTHSSQKRSSQQRSRKASKVKSPKLKTDRKVRQSTKKKRIKSDASGGAKYPSQKKHRPTADDDSGREEGTEFARGGGSDESHSGAEEGSRGQESTRESMPLLPVGKLPGVASTASKEARSSAPHQHGALGGTSHRKPHSSQYVRNAFELTELDDDGHDDSAFRLDQREEKLQDRYRRLNRKLSQKGRSRKSKELHFRCAEPDGHHSSYIQSTRIELNLSNLLRAKAEQRKEEIRKLKKIVRKKRPSHELRSCFVGSTDWSPNLAFPLPDV